VPIKPDYGFHERKVSNVFVLNVAATQGSILTRDTTNTAVVGAGDCTYGSVALGSVAVQGDRELGFLFWDVTATGASFFNTISGILDLTTAIGTPVAIYHANAGDIVSTDAYLASGLGAITAGAVSGNTAPDTLLGVLNGKYVLASAFASPAAGSAVRAKLIGNAVINSVQAIRVQVL